MKTFTKVALIIGGVALSAGIALTTIGAIANKGKPIYMYYDHGFHIDNEGKVFEQEKMVVDDFTSVTIDVPASEIHFIESDEYAVEYKLNAREVKCESKNGTLTVDTDTKKFHINFGINWSSEDYFVNVYYPKGADFDLITLDVSAGDVNIDKGFDCNKLSLDISAGDVTISNVNGALDVDMSAGDFTATDCTFGNSIFDMSAGDVELHNCTVDGGKVDMSAGSFTAKELILTKSFSMDMSAGSVTIKFVDGQEIGYDFDMSAGTAKINGEKKGDEYEEKKGYDVILSVDASAGSVDITNN